MNISLSFYSALKLDFMTSSKHNNGTGRDYLDKWVDFKASQGDNSPVSN